MMELMCAIGVVTTSVAQSGRISALAGRKGRLRACYIKLPASITDSD
ncbi:TPA: replication protein RepA4 [Salmonella enterica]|nr:replication protein RepA4 [Salmonella enterica subsp. enterica serovar Chester]EDH8245986.1 replication protein RepA4 [Salmonella enterica subsp. enterica serovar Chester]HAF2404626.1 replication protein RepA4 [Salmonella enterica]